MSTVYPKIILTLTTFDKLLEVFGLLLLIIIWGYVIYNYPTLPETIPTHYGVGGKVDGFGGKSTIFMLIGVMTLMYVGLSFISKIPHKFNYLVEITDDNRYYQYDIAVRMVRMLKLAIVLILGLITYTSISNALGNNSDLTSWFMPLTLLFTLSPCVYFMIKSSSGK